MPYIPSAVPNGILRRLKKQSISASILPHLLRLYRPIPPMILGIDKKIIMSASTNLDKKSFQMENLIREINTKQKMLEAKLIEVTISKDTNIGIDWVPC